MAIGPFVSGPGPRPVRQLQARIIRRLVQAPSPNRVSPSHLRSPVQTLHLPSSTVPPLAELQAASLDTLYVAVCQDYSPRGIVETEWCRNIAQYMHHAQRMRVIRDQYLDYLRVAVFRELTRPTMEDRVESFRATEIAGLSDMDADHLVALLRHGRSHAESRGLGDEYNRAVSRLTAFGVTPDNAAAKAYMDNIARLDAVEKLILATEHRRDTVIRDLEYKQQSRVVVSRDALTQRQPRSMRRKV